MVLLSIIQINLKNDLLSKFLHKCGTKSIYLSFNIFSTDFMFGSISIVSNLLPMYKLGFMVFIAKNYAIFIGHASY